MKLLALTLLMIFNSGCQKDNPLDDITCTEPDPCDCPIPPENCMVDECTESDPCDCPNAPDNCEQGNVLTVTLDPQTTYQTIESFGASDAWSTQFVGKNWPLNTRQEIAKLLFSTEIDDGGKPLGIGLTAWRFNIGGGSAEQGNGSDINDEWRRAESFIDTDGNYDWTKQQGQQWFLQEAAKYNVDNFTAFVNSPPVAFTKNGKAYSDDGESANLAADKYQDYADFLMNVMSNVQANTGVRFKYLSPFNEPQWEWRCCNQEGSPWNNDEIAAVTRLIDGAITREQLDTKIELTEAGSLDFLINDNGNPARGDQIFNFWSSSSDMYLGDLSNLAPSVAGHSYFTTYDLNRLVSTRETLNNRIKQVDPELKFVMSEYTLLENHEEIRGPGRDLGIDPALYMARVVHADLVFGNAVSWQWWLAVSPYDYKDGLVYIDFNKDGGSYYESKMLWGLGNFSRFIRPGMKRMAVSRSDNLSKQAAIADMLQSAYISGDEMVVVFVNQTQEGRTIKFEGIDTEEYESIEVYQTNATRNMERIRAYDDLDAEIIIGPRSIVTCVIKKQ